MNELLKIRIGMLRQWLNEDRITDSKKLVTNDDLIYWLRPAIEVYEAKNMCDQCGKPFCPRIATLGKHMTDEKGMDDECHGVH